MRIHRETLARIQHERRDSGDFDNGPLSGVYFLRCGLFVKIGVSTNVVARLSQIQCGNPYQVTPAGFIPEPNASKAEALEAGLHALFDAHHHAGEWFRECPPLTTFIGEHAKAWPVEL